MPEEVGNSVTRNWRLWLAGAALGCGAAMVFAGTKVASDYAARPDVPKISSLSTSKVVLDRNDVLLRAFTSQDQKWRLPVTLDAVDPLYVKMLVAFEDKRFFSHDGVDFKALARAGWQALTTGRFVSGGSTLTMQVARLLREKPTKTLSAKYQQLLRALQLESSLTKDDILLLYMLRAPFGGNLEGVRAASLVWFGKEPKRLTAAEAALLVALPQSPEARRPDRFAERARKARDRVLDRAVRAGVITDDTAAAAKKDPVTSDKRHMPLLAAHAARNAVEMAPEKTVHRLTLDAELQRGLESLLKARVQTMGPYISAAAIVADHRTGEILASVGSPGLLLESRQGHIDMTNAVRSPGSTLKPLIYGLAFEQGIAHPESFIDDRPIDIGGYKPTNFDKAYQGTVTVREALQLSLNTPAVQLLEAVGPARLIARLKRVGATPELVGRKAPGLAIGLGGVGLTLKELVSLYAALARQGEPVSLKIEKDRKNSVRLETSVLEPIASWHIADILSGLPQPQSAGTFAVAYKTGTAYGYRDSWAIGFDGHHVVGIWVGRADATPVPGATGAKAAAPILFEAFQRLGKERVPLAVKPKGTLSRPTAALPLPLRHARLGDAHSRISGSKALRIAYPPSGALVDLGLATGNRQTLVVKVQGGVRPYTVLMNGSPVYQALFDRQIVFRPEAAGFADVTVVDAAGVSARVSLQIK